MIGLGLGITEQAVRAVRSGASAPPATPAQPAGGFARFPALSAGWAAGRGLVSIIGDSTTFGLGSGSGGFYSSAFGANATNPASYLRQALNAGGVTAIDGCVVYGARNQENSLGGAGRYYDPDPFAVAGGTWAYRPNVEWWPAWTTTVGPYGLYAWNADLGQSLGYDFGGMTWDRLEFFHLGQAAPASAGSGFALSRGTTAIGTALVDGPTGPRKAGFSLAAGTGALVATTVGDKHAGVDPFVCGGAARVWNSAVQCVQVETLGNPNWQTSDWVTPTNLLAIDGLGSHLFIVNLGLNDRKVGGRTADAYKADLKTLATRCLATGADVLLAVPTPGSDATSEYELPADYIAAVGSAASELGLAAPVNLRAIGLDHDGDYYDNVHLRASGYRKVGEAYAARLLAA